MAGIAWRGTGPVLVTGAGGFVGTHLSELLGDEVFAVEADVMDAEAVADAVKRARPRAVVHLAALSWVPQSWREPARVWEVNVVGTVNVLEAVRRGQPRARVLFASTGEVYGRADRLPAPEDTPVAPVSPYAASKAAAEIACGQAREAGLDVVVARAFQHEGPGRDERFAVGSWARQLAELELEGGGALRVGNLDVERDITDVRDVCRAYQMLLGPSVEGGTYNVASGRSVPLQDVLDLLVQLARCPVKIEPDPERLRPMDIPVLSGEASRLQRATGWRPELPLEQTLADMLDDARRTVRQERMAKV
jgi:GDP-4-dehydro-6-deoxy-D-mannose reductase